MSYQPQLIIDMDIVSDNIKLLAQDKKPCLMVKANQYHVLENIKPLVDLGYDFFGVSTLDEAQLILNNFDVDVLIVTPIVFEDMVSFNHPRLHFSVVDIDTLKQVTNQYNVHLNFDTGMGRIGFKVEMVSQVIEIVKQRDLHLKGIYTHFPCASDQIYTLGQIDLFKTIIDRFKEEGTNPTYIHCQNSLGAFLYNVEFCNMVRPGIGIWGYGANLEEAKLTPIKPALKLIAPVSFIKDYQGLIGYDHLDQVDGIIATIKLGYNDGLDRRLRGYDFKPGKIVGNVCMCQTMLEVPNNDISSITIFEENSIYDLCNYINCSVYELLCSLSFRIKRVIKGGVWHD